MSDMQSLGEIAGYIMKNALSYRSVLRDVRDGRCSAVYGPDGNIESVTYHDGRTFPPSGRKFHTGDLATYLKIIDHARKMAASADPLEKQTGKKILNLAFRDSD